MLRWVSLRGPRLNPLSDENSVVVADGSRGQIALVFVVFRLDHGVA